MDTESENGKEYEVRQNKFYTAALIEGHVEFFEWGANHWWKMTCLIPKN